eukprot:900341_1
MGAAALRQCAPCTKAEYFDTNTTRRQHETKIHLENESRDSIENDLFLSPTAKRLKSAQKVKQKHEIELQQEIEEFNNAIPMETDNLNENNKENDERQLE